MWERKEMLNMAEMSSPWNWESVEEEENELVVGFGGVGDESFRRQQVSSWCYQVSPPENTHS